MDGAGTVVGAGLKSDVEDAAALSGVVAFGVEEAKLVLKKNMLLKH